MINNQLKLKLYFSDQAFKIFLSNSAENFSILAFDSWQGIFCISYPFGEKMSPKVRKRKG